MCCSRNHRELSRAAVQELGVEAQREPRKYRPWEARSQGQWRFTTGVKQGWEVIESALWKDHSDVKKRNGMGSDESDA